MVEAVLEDVAVAGNGEFFVVLLRTLSGDFIPITIGHPEALSILAGRSQEPLSRPLAHDLMLSSLELLGASLNRVEITELVTTEGGGTFYGRVIIDSRGIEFDLDARPSDALALAVRVGVPIWVSEEGALQAGMTDFGGGGAEA